MLQHEVTTLQHLARELVRPRKCTPQVAASTCGMLTNLVSLSGIYDTVDKWHTFLRFVMEYLELMYRCLAHN